MRTALVAAILLGALPARAGGTWSDEPDAELAAHTDDYEKAMSDGDKAALLAASESTNGARLKKLVFAAAREYELAAAARPDLAEPHWRAANVLFGFFFDCDIGPLCTDPSREPAIARRVIGHWDAIEEIDPLDPRLLPSHFGAGVLFSRALLRTKLATDEDLALSIGDYEKWLDRTQADDPNRGRVLGNLAEGYMMIGDLENSIVTYRRALDSAPETSIYYGLAVAYDRDGHGKKAREIMNALGEEQFQSWADDVARGNTFYVPEGEAYCYLGLAYESLGYPKDAIKNYRAFVKSGAHPQYQARAKENIAALTPKKDEKKDDKK
jgi:tetratricopeptide (TPR) repeat protein